MWQYPVGDELVIARCDVQGLFLLNGTARLIWDELNRGAATAEIAESFVSRYGVPRPLARRDIEATLAGWSQGLLLRTPAKRGPDVESSSVLRDFERSSAAVEINCVLNGCGFRVLLDPGDLVEEIGPRLAQTAVPRLPRDSPIFTIALVNGADRVFVFRDGVCIAGEEKTSGARAILLQEMTSLCDPDREPNAILHAGACGTPSGCVILAGPSQSGKSTLCAALMSAGFCCYSDDSVVLDRHFRVCGMPFPVMLRESSWPALESRFASFRERSSVHRRSGHNVRFLPSNLPGSASPAVAANALVFVDYRPDAQAVLRPLTQFEALLELQRGGFWVEHNRESIAQFLAWIGRLACCKLTYSRIDDASDAIKGLLG
jgi:hypothetical protein